ncbi:hypothetical protein R3P38DRAFT_2932378 [Favolaschia claudopus]|uniref:Secreted protein n=1 Tax=Favolaschia claudopus TaxID=2862362 RepID=A0AAW0BT88_9AGAR
MVALGIAALALFFVCSYWLSTAPSRCYPAHVSTCGLKAQLSGLCMSPMCTSRTRVQSDSPRLRLLQCDSLSIRRMNPRYILVSSEAECLYLSCYDLNT